MSADREQILAMREWLRYAEGDLFSAKVLAANTGLPSRNACYMAQQSAEKALKAALIAVKVDVMRTHDLDALVQKLPNQQKVKFAMLDLSWLSEWAVEARYPGDWSEASANHATKAIDIAECVYSQVKSLIDQTPMVS